MKKIDLIFHIGRQKTATTFIQASANKIEGVFLIGKNLNRKYEGKIDHLHNELFKSYRGEIIGRYPNPSLNNYSIINEYADEVSRIIYEKNRDYDKFLISDENISNYLNNLAELNIGYCIIIGNLIEEKIKDKFSLSKNISLTIRNQVDIIYSIYCYNSLFSGGIRNFVNKSFSDSNSGFLSSIYYYKCYKYIQGLCSQEWNINLVPYEILGKQKNTNEFFRKLFNADTEIKMKISTKTNRVNSNSLDHDRKLKRNGSLILKIGHILSSGYLHSFKKANKKKLISRFYFRFLIVIGNLFIFLHRILKKIGLMKRDRPIIIDNETIKLIKDKFRDDNIKLENEFNDLELKNLGYF